MKPQVNDLFALNPAPPSDPLSNGSFTLNAVMGSVSDAVLIVDQTGGIIAVNPAMVQFLRFNDTEDCRRWLAECSDQLNYSTCDKQPLPTERSPMRRALNGQSGSGEVYRLHRSDIDQGWLGRFSYSPIRDQLGRLQGAVVAVREMTEPDAVETQLQVREEQMLAILNTAADAIITIDSHGIIRVANVATERMFGYRLSELIGQNIHMLMPEPYRSAHDGYIRRYLATGSGRMVGQTRELLAQRKDGSSFPVRIAVSQIDHLQWFTGVIHDVSERVELQRQVLEIAAEEDRRIGHELHDSLQQQLTGICLMAQTLDELLQRRHLPEAALAHRLASSANDAGREAQMLARGLIPVDVDAEGLSAALAHLAEATSQNGKVRCQFAARGDVGINNNTTATHLYRIAQEAVNNALRHGLAQEIRIALTGGYASQELTIEDDGIGLAPSDQRSGGCGLRIMQYRASMIGATIEIFQLAGAAQGRGTCVRCTWPHSYSQGSRPLPSKATGQ